MIAGEDLDLYASYSGLLLGDVTNVPLATIIKCQHCRYCILTEVMNGEENYGCNRFGLPVEYYYSACSFGEHKPEGTPVYSTVK